MRNSVATVTQHRLAWGSAEREREPGRQREKEAYRRRERERRICDIHIV